MVGDSGTYPYTGRAHPSMRNMRPTAPPKDRLMRAARQEVGGIRGAIVSMESALQLSD